MKDLYFDFNGYFSNNLDSDERLLFLQRFFASIQFRGILKEEDLNKIFKGLYETIQKHELKLELKSQKGKSSQEKLKYLSQFFNSLIIKNIPVRSLNAMYANIEEAVTNYPDDLMEFEIGDRVTNEDLPVDYGGGVTQLKNLEIIEFIGNDKAKCKYFSETESSETEYYEVVLNSLKYVSRQPLKPKELSEDAFFKKHLGIK